MLAADEVHVAAQDARLHVVGVDHVVGHQQELLAGQPVVVLLDDPGQLGDRPGRRVALQDQVQHGHEVALAAAEAAVQVGRLAGAALDGAADERQGRVEVLGQLGRDHVVGQHHVGVFDVLGQPEDEVALLHAVGDLDQVFDEGHRITCKMLLKFACFQITIP